MIGVMSTKNINYYNPDKENEILTVFDDIIIINHIYMINNKKLNSVVTELFIGERKLDITLVFNTQSCFNVLKDVRLNTDERGLKQIAINHSSGISTKDFANIYRKCTVKPYSLLVNDATLASENLLRFIKLYLE